MQPDKVKSHIQFTRNVAKVNTFYADRIKRLDGACVCVLCVRRWEGGREKEIRIAIGF